MHYYGHLPYHLTPFGNCSQAHRRFTAVPQPGIALQKSLITILYNEMAAAGELNGTSYIDYIVDVDPTGMHKYQYCEIICGRENRSPQGCGWQNWRRPIVKVVKRARLLLTHPICGPGALPLEQVRKSQIRS